MLSTCECDRDDRTQSQSSETLEEVKAHLTEAKSAETENGSGEETKPIVNPHQGK